jgi:hypothetical protein
LVGSAFGAHAEVVGDNPPWVQHLADDDVETAVARTLDAHDVATCHQRGWIPRVDETLAYYRETLADYPNVAQSVSLSIPDLQGPFDTAELLWGSDILLALYTNPDLVQRLLTAVSATMVHLYRHFRHAVGAELLPEGFAHQHGSVIRGSIMLRCDGNVLTGPDHYRRHVLDHDMGVLRQLGGGSIHSCGCWQAIIPTFIAQDEVGSLDFGSNQSHLNDMTATYELAQRHRKHLNLWAVPEQDLRSGGARERFPLGVTFALDSPDVAHATDLMNAYRQTADT